MRLFAAMMLVIAVDLAFYYATPNQFRNEHSRWSLIPFVGGIWAYHAYMAERKQ